MPSCNWSSWPGTEKSVRTKVVLPCVRSGSKSGKSWGGYELRHLLMCKFHACLSAMLA